MEQQEGDQEMMKADMAVELAASTGQVAFENVVTPPMSKVIAT